MKPLRIGLRLALLAVVALAAWMISGCTSGPKPDKLLKAYAEAKTHGVAMRANIGTAKEHIKAAGKSHVATVESHGKAFEHITILVPAVNSLALRVPDEFKVEVKAMKTQVDELNLVIALATGSAKVTTTEIAGAEQRLVLAEQAGEKWAAKQTEIETTLAPEYLAQVKATISELNDRLNTLLGLGGIVLAGFAAFAATRFVRPGVPATWSIPAITFAVVYAGVWIWGRFGKL